MLFLSNYSYDKAMGQALVEAMDRPLFKAQVKTALRSEARRMGDRFHQLDSSLNSLGWRDLLLPRQQLKVERTRVVGIGTLISAALDPSRAGEDEPSLKALSELAWYYQQKADRVVASERAIHGWARGDIRIGLALQKRGSPHTRAANLGTLFNLLTAETKEP